jgi:tetratricopeptide (TPR) repeat protein
VCSSDLEERPFESRYEERDLLGKVARQAAANAAAEAEGSAAARRARVIEALANGLIGKNFMETEEPGSAQAKLEAAIAGLEGVAEESAAHVEVLNSLGVLWANRGETQTSLELFERAIAAHAKARTEERVTSDAEALQRLEDQHTLTTFYLAQAYGNLGERTKSAAHCFETMRRQLARRGKSGGGEFAFDPAQWARNAVDLARYYSAVDRYEVAEHCLRAAEAILVSARHEAKLAREAAASKAEASASGLAAQERLQKVGAACAGRLFGTICPHPLSITASIDALRIFNLGSLHQAKLPTFLCFSRGYLLAAGLSGAALCRSRPCPSPTSLGDVRSTK